MRWASDDVKKAYFAKYNAEIAPYLNEPKAHFSMWANVLASIHPPEQTVVELPAIGDSSYAERYLFSKSEVKVVADAVYHFLTPVDSNDRPVQGKRSILLLRGTAPHPATYTVGPSGSASVSQTSQQAIVTQSAPQTSKEPRGYWADTNIFSIGSVSYAKIENDVQTWMSQQVGGLTLVGQSLAGNLALRALKTDRESNNRHDHGTELYTYSAAGVDRGTANYLSENFSEEVLHMQWHAEDFIAKTGYYPAPVDGRVFSRHSLDIAEPDLPKLKWA